MSTTRQELIQQVIAAKPKADSADVPSSLVWNSVWCSNVMTLDKLEQRLTKAHFRQLKESIKNSTPLETALADSVAAAIKDWSIENGATSFCHWFQPIHIATAEKHEAFLEYTGAIGSMKTILNLSGGELVRGEPDASSFPNGGIRNTSQARGYTIWDPSSPCWLRQGTNGKILMIPTCFASWTGDALDVKTPLLRSTEALSRETSRLLRLIGDTKVVSVNSTLGAEQEFFVVDRRFFTARPDLLFAGRTVLGARPPKGQEMEDHYFAAVPPRILAYLEDVERQCWKLGIPARTRHNEVAPGQHEIAPVFEFSNVASDHNTLMMGLMQETAAKHDLVPLFHEKPFAGVNGSGKHNNWSMCTDYGLNLLNPTKNPRESLVFQTFLTASIAAVDIHADLLRAAIAVPGNDWRLGANEAPPAIMSVYLGSEVNDVVEWLLNDCKEADSLTKKVASTLALGAGVTPFKRDRTDRNRTSPFAFTGNKFEFRAVGSSQSVGHIVTVLNTIAADACRILADELQAELKNTPDLTTATRKVLKATLLRHKRVIFNGNGYSKEWIEEAEKRGLLNLRESVVAIEQYIKPKNTALFKDMAVLSPEELSARSNIYYDHYSHTINVEAQVAHNMVQTLILPSTLKHQLRVASSLKALIDCGVTVDSAPQKEHLVEVTTAINNLTVANKKLKAVLEESHNSHGDSHTTAKFYRDSVKPAITGVRQWADALEVLVEDELWPVPKYADLLFVK